jgi:FdrA protein
MLDLGSDEYTLGRPHPMIDFGPRLAMVAQAAGDPSVGVRLLDVVLGHGAHPHPAAELAPAIRDASAALPVVVSLIATPDDPQGLARQALALQQAGAHVCLSNAQAARHAIALVTP